MKRKALLIGINKYQTLGKLSFARQDAEAFAETLCDHYGFSSHDINLMTCQTEGAGAAFSRYVELAISDLVQYKDLDLMIFGFWGHGFAPEPGKRYLCGLDTIVDDLERTAVSMDVIKAKLSQVGAENTLLVLDCCQNKPTGRSVETETLSRGEEAELSSLARDIQTARREESKMTIPTVAVLNSCREGQRAYEWQQREHGIFTAHLLDQMGGRVSSVAQLASSIFDPVTQTAMNLHRQKQTPFVVIEGKGDITISVIDASKKNKKNDNLCKDKQVAKSSGPSKTKVEPKQSSKVSPVSPPKRNIKPPVRQRVSANWWAAFEEGEKGPFTKQQIEVFINNGRITSSTELWKAGDPSWQQADEMEEWKNVLPIEKVASTDTHNILVKSYAKRKLEAYLSMSQTIKMSIGDSYVPLEASEIRNMQEDIQIDIARNSLYMGYEACSEQVDYSEKPEIIICQTPALIEKYRKDKSVVCLEIRKLEAKKESDYEHPYEYKSANNMLGQLYFIAGDTEKSIKHFRMLLSRDSSWNLIIGLATLGYTADHELVQEIYDSCKNKLTKVHDYINSAKILLELRMDKAHVGMLLKQAESMLASKIDAYQASDIAQIRLFELEQVDKAERIICNGIDRSDDTSGFYSLAELSFFGLNNHELAFSAIAKMVQSGKYDFDILDVARLCKLLGKRQKASNLYKKYHKMRKYGSLGSMTILDAERGDSESQYLMGCLLMDGSKGCYKDKQEAEKWFRKSAQQGNKDAQKALDGGCFLTTVVCGVLDKPDDCHELNVLRRLRDTFMQETPERKAEVEEYYKIAPLIIDAVKSKDNASVVWQRLANQYILPCIKHVEGMQSQKAYQLYREMVHELKERYLDISTERK